jgi:hypothetical protein
MHNAKYNPLDYLKNTNSHSYKRFGKLCFSNSSVMILQLAKFLIKDFLQCNKLIRTSYSQVEEMSSIK